MARAHAFRTVNHTLFNDRVLKLGTFSPNLTGGCALFNIEGVLQTDWPSTLNLAQTTDAMEFEALVPVGRWKGFGGVTNFNNAGFQSFFWASAISASTRSSQPPEPSQVDPSPSSSRPGVSDCMPPLPPEEKARGVTSNSKMIINICKPFALAKTVSSKLGFVDRGAA